MQQFPYSNKKVLITAGATCESIDLHSYISSKNNGMLAYSLANFLVHQGAQVIMVSAPVRIDLQHPRLTIYQVQSALEMDAVCCKYFDQVDMVIFGADIPKYRPERVAPTKKNAENAMYLKMVPNIDIAYEFGRVKSAYQLSVGFAYDHENAADPIQKMEKKHFDLIITLPEMETTGFNLNEQAPFGVIEKDYTTHIYQAMSYTEAAKKISFAIQHQAHQNEALQFKTGHLNSKSKCA
ncbi:MAG: hypothetical protein RLY16_1378 [Bacteroidota bacterium]|jgi:phosphopantothenoylcysteine decarboxylase/phosphopantothenate--cysteine ligase